METKCIQCSGLKNKLLIERLNEEAKIWEICSISCIENKQSNDEENNKKPQHCNTMFSVNIVNTTMIITSIACNDFKKKWRFISPSKIASAQNASSSILYPIQGIYRKKNKKKCVQQDNNHDDDDSNTNNHQKDPDYNVDDEYEYECNDKSMQNTNNKMQSSKRKTRKRKFKEIHDELVDLVSTSSSDDNDDDEVTFYDAETIKITKRQKLNNSNILISDNGRFDELDKYLRDHSDKFPTLESIESLFKISKNESKKLALRYFRERVAEKEYVLMETNEYRCTKCNAHYNNDGMGVDSLKKIKDHIVIHSEKAFKCPVCQKAFQLNHHLLYHLRQKKDGNGAHEKYYKQKIYPNDKLQKENKKKKRIRSKVNKGKASNNKAINKKIKKPKIKIIKPIQQNNSFTFHDYNIIKTNTTNMNIGNMIQRSIPRNGPPPLLPVQDEETSSNSIAKPMLTQHKSDALSPKPPSANAHYSIPYVVTSLPKPADITPPSPYDVTPLTITTTLYPYPLPPIAPPHQE